MQASYEGAGVTIFAMLDFDYLLGGNFFLSLSSHVLKIQDGGHLFREEMLSVRSPKIRLYCMLSIFQSGRVWVSDEP